jgi:hypothetical protein
MSSEKIKVYIPCGGGLGDVIQAYLSSPKNHWTQSYDDPDNFPTSDNYLSLWFRRLEDFKQKNPDSSVIVKSMCHNPAVTQLFEYHPAIDFTELIEYNLDGGDWWKQEYDGYKNIRYLESDSDDNNDYEKYKWSYPTIYMSDYESLIAKQIINRGRYVVLHPFAGLKHREPLGLVWYDMIANAFIREGYNVIVIGGSYKRNTSGKEETIEEYPRNTDKGFYNMLGFSLRTFLYLILNSDGFVGTHSSMILPAWWAKKRSVCIVPTTHDGGQAWEEFATSGNPTAWGFGQSFNKTIIKADNTFSMSELCEVVRWIDVS